jgi:hypothetical protein
MAKTVAGKISGVLNRKSFVQLWMCIAWNWGDLVKNFLLISKEMSFIIKMVWSLFELFQKKSPKPWPEKTLVWLIWYQIYDFKCVLLEIVGSWWNCFYWFSNIVCFPMAMPYSATYMYTVHVSYPKLFIAFSRFCYFEKQHTYLYDFFKRCSLEIAVYTYMCTFLKPGTWGG